MDKKNKPITSPAYYPFKKRGRKPNADKQFKLLDENEYIKSNEQANKTLQEFLKPKRPKIDPQPYQNQAANAYQYQYQQQQQTYGGYVGQMMQPAQNPQPYYTKERIDAALKQYERLNMEYKYGGITYSIKLYLEKMPELCKKLKVLEMDNTELLNILQETAKLMMLDEFEIINWIKFIERFDFQGKALHLELFFIALATKLLLNNQKHKEPFEVFLSWTNPNFYKFNQWITTNNGKFYQDRQDALICHRIFRKLNKDLYPKVDLNQIQREIEAQKPIDYNKMVEDLPMPNNSSYKKGDSSFRDQSQISQSKIPSQLTKNGSRKQQIVIKCDDDEDDEDIGPLPDIHKEKDYSSLKPVSFYNHRSNLEESKVESKTSKASMANNNKSQAKQQSKSGLYNHSMMGSLLTMNSPLINILNHQLPKYDTPAIPEIDFTKRESSTFAPPNFSKWNMFGNVEFNDPSKNNNLINNNSHATKQSKVNNNSNSSNSMNNNQDNNKMPTLNNFDSSLMLQFGSQQLNDQLKNFDFEDIEDINNVLLN